MSQIVTISRKWNNPHIHIKVDNLEIRISMDIADFKEAIKREIGSVRFVFTLKEFENRLDKAFEAVIQGMKEESAKVV